MYLKSERNIKKKKTKTLKDTEARGFTVLEK
jgi:hypothetical protein